MPGIVDPRPAQRAQLRHLRQQLDGAVNDADRQRIQAEIDELERSMGHRRGVVRALLGWGHHSVPW
ncbi:MAG TPA: hypothetical protein VFA84_04095 [Acidimicrobiales bacterium]|nr:hypothetical protein [Acidimicrobiales bacterium]